MDSLSSQPESMTYQNPYLHPKPPFVGNILDGLFEGKSITITGRVLPGANRFHVNLHSHAKESTDIAFQFNPRYRGLISYVVCNTFQGSSWGSEQLSFKNPLSRGSDFTLTFLVNRDSYSVMVNGVHYLEYLHRLPFSSVNTISVDGGVDIQSIAFQNPTKAKLVKKQSMEPPKDMSKLDDATLMKEPPPYSPPLFNDVHVSQPNVFNSKAFRNESRHLPPNMKNQDQADPNNDSSESSDRLPHVYVVPYKAVIQGGLNPGKVITVEGFVNDDSDRFCINLRFNSGIAFHLNPRFNERVVVRNSLLKDSWGREERAGGMPFQRSQHFTVTITCKEKCYKVMVNGQQMFTYKHRYPMLQEIDIMEVQGNVRLDSVTV